MTDLARSTSAFASFALMGLIAVGVYWIVSPRSHSGPHRDAIVTLKQPQIICRSVDSIRRMGRSGSKPYDIALPRILVRECKIVEAGTELTVEEVGRAVARVRERDAVASAYASADQIMANVPMVASK